MMLNIFPWAYLTVYFLFREFSKICLLKKNLVISFLLSFEGSLYILDFSFF